MPLSESLDWRRVFRALGYYLAPVRAFNNLAEPIVWALFFFGVVVVTMALPAQVGIPLLALMFLVLGVIACYRLMGPDPCPNLRFTGSDPKNVRVNRSTAHYDPDSGTHSNAISHEWGFFTRIKIGNRPRDGVKTLAADQVHARITYFDTHDREVGSMPTGRWAGNPEVAQVPAADIQTTTIAIGSEGILDLVVKYHGGPEAFMWGNHGAVEDKPLPGGRYWVLIELDDPALPTTECIWLELETREPQNCIVSELSADPRQITAPPASDTSGRQP